MKFILISLMFISSSAFASSVKSGLSIGGPIYNGNAGSILVTSPAGTIAQVPIGTTGQVLTVSPGAATGIAWSSAGGTGTVTSVTGTSPVSVTNGTTTPVVSITPGNNGQVLTTSAGAVGWNALNLASTSAITGILPGTNGGTGVSSTATYPTSGTIDTTTAANTLTNKTLTSPTITSPSMTSATVTSGGLTVNSGDLTTQSGKLSSDISSTPEANGGEVLLQYSGIFGCQTTTGSHSCNTCCSGVFTGGSCIGEFTSTHSSISCATTLSSAGGSYLACLCMFGT